MNTSLKRALIIVPSIALAGIFATGAAIADGKSEGKDCQHGKGEHAQEGGHKGGKKGGMMDQRMDNRMGKRMVKQLDLTDAQGDAIKDVMQAHHQGAKSGHADMATQFSELAQLESGSDAYIAKAKAIGAMQGEIMAQRLIDKANIEAQIIALLTPEQAEKFAEMQDEMAEHRADRMEKHGKKGKYSN